MRLLSSISKQSDLAEPPKDVAPPHLAMQPLKIFKLELKLVM